nr:Gag-Pol polyprotein [Tanacetum cinerariifolium]
MKGLSECKSSKSNVRRIQVKYIVKKVKDHLKTYSSARIDISCFKNTRDPIMSGTLPPIPPPLRTSAGSPSGPNANRVDMMPNADPTTTTTTNVARNVIGENNDNLPQLLDSRGGFYVTNVLAFDIDDFTSWKIRLNSAWPMKDHLTLETLKITALRLKFNAFKELEGEKVNGTYTRLKCLLNDFENNGVVISQSEVNATFVNSLPRKWLSMNQTQGANNSIKNDSLAALYGKYHYEEGLIDDIYADSDVEEDNRINNEFMANMNAEYHERVLLANQKRFYKRSERDDESVSSKDEGTTKFKAFMEIAEDEPSAGKGDTRSSQWVEITIKKVHRLLSMTEELGFDPGTCGLWAHHAIVNSPQPIYDQEPSMVDADDETSKDKEIDKLMALISLLFKKIYKPTNNNLRTSSNTSRANQDNSPRINRNAGYENQRIDNVAGAREIVGSSVEEAEIQLNAEQADWRDDTNDDELEDQELEAHYMYMAQLQEVSPDAADSGPIFNDEPLQKVSNDDHYNVFAMESAHPEKSKPVHDTYPIEQDTQNVIIDSLDMNYNREEIDQNDDGNDLAKERELLAFLIKKLKCEIDESKNRNKLLETSNKVLIEKLKGEIENFKNKNISLESSNNFFKEANNRLSETNNLLYADYKKSEAELARRNSKEYTSQMELECAKVRDDLLSYKLDYQKSYEVTNLQCDYLELLEKCEGLETELSKSKMMSKSFESVQTHAINLEIELQQCKEKIKNDMLFKVNQTKDFCKEHEQYFEIQDLKAQLQDKEAEYVSLPACCAQVLWMRTQLTDYGFHFDKIPMYCDSKAAIAISCNPIQHSRTKHIDVRYHFIKKKVEKGIVELLFVRTEYQIADLFTKALPVEMFKYLVRRL